MRYSEQSGNRLRGVQKASSPDIMIIRVIITTGQKSNRMQAEDLILRDYILSAASEIYAGGGANGRNVAVVKSDLIDLELLAA